MSTKSKIEIYTNETCPYCKQIKEELTKANIEFEERIASDNKKEWTEVGNITNMSTFPTIHYNGSYFIPSRDFTNPQQLIKILKNFEPIDKSINTVLERTKTLNYNIATAFNRLDQLLKQIENKLNTNEDEHESTS